MSTKAELTAKIRNAVREAENLARVVETMPGQEDAMTLREFRKLRNATDSLCGAIEELSDDVYHIGNPRSPVRPMPAETEEA